MIDEWGKGAKYWTKTWNPVIGCKKVSEGCTNCYAESMAKRFPSLCDENGGFTPHVTRNPRKTPRNGVVFVGNMTDIFGEFPRSTQPRAFLVADEVSIEADGTIRIWWD